MPVALWNFAADCYALPGVAEVCLYAQDRYSADVNMLLTAAWLAARDARWQPGDVIALNELCAEWRAHCVQPLRSVRRYLKNKTGADTLYAHVKGLELEAEKHQLEMLESFLMGIGGTGSNSANALAHNLNIYLNTLTTVQRDLAGVAEQLIVAIRPALDAPPLALRREK